MTSQIGWMSRKRTYSTDSSIPTPTAKVASSSDERDQLEPAHPRSRRRSRGEHEHRDKLIARLNSAVSATDERDHQARKAHLAQQPLARQQALHAAARRLDEEGPEDDRRQQIDGVVEEPPADLEYLGEDHVEDAEEQQRPDERPQ